MGSALFAAFVPAMQSENLGADAHAQSQGMSDAAKAADERNKASRWQIASGSLSMLESVYAVEPFPGLDTRRELARKLNVSARQVQVWFQNKRQASGRSRVRRVFFQP